MNPQPPVHGAFHEPIPPPFLYLRVQDLDLTPTITGLCAGYEGGEWRAKALADHMMEWLPEFALRGSQGRSPRRFAGGFAATDSPTNSSDEPSFLARPGNLWVSPHSA